jgi:hypothetical protein
MITKCRFESNYKNYYRLYKNYASNNFKQTNINDETNLVNLCASCPGTDGACVYQARALYNAVFNALPNYPHCQVSSARVAKSDEISKAANPWEINLYPNPVNDKLTIESSDENDLLKITISDLSGRILTRSDTQLNGYTVTMDISLINGVYVITVTNSDNEKLIRKLIINN